MKKSINQTFSVHMIYDIFRSDFFVEPFSLLKLQFVRCVVELCHIYYVCRINESYQAIEGGFTQDGMEDLTGGIAVNYGLGNETPVHLFRTLHK